jgi:hypothetical protein
MRKVKTFRSALTSKSVNVLLSSSVNTSQMTSSPFLRKPP